MPSRQLFLPSTQAIDAIRQPFLPEPAPETYRNSLQPATYTYRFHPVRVGQPFVCGLGFTNEADRGPYLENDIQQLFSRSGNVFSLAGRENIPLPKIREGRL